MSFKSPTFEKKIVLKDLQEKVKKAKSEKKIFLVYEGYEPLRLSFLAREWIEKISDYKLPSIPSNSEKFMLALLLKNFPFFYVWQPKSRPVKNQQNVSPVINSIYRDRLLDYTSKDGLNNCSELYRWYHIDGVTDLTYQRSHVMFDKKAKDEFLEDFRRTAITSFIMFLDNAGDDLEHLFSTNEDSVTISTDCITFAIQKIELFIRFDNHEDLETNQIFDNCAKFPKNQKEFLDDFRLVIKGKKKIMLDGEISVQNWREQIQECAKKVMNQWPHLKYDGYKNIWILKPIGSSSGHGVKVMTNEGDISMAIQNSQPKCLLQKYVEKPLLIQNRKFDMRIYFIVYIRDGFVDLWLYKDCYAKFSTSMFTLEKMHQSIHVTNYAVQKNYMNPLDTVDNAKENMWSLNELLNYFTLIGEGHIWHSKIYPALKRNIIAVVLESLECTDMQINNFELNGADFMLGFDYEPILIEVNSKPALFFSRTVVEMITNKLLEDVVKVTVDWQRDQFAPTGDFEMIYCFEIPQVDDENISLTVRGHKIESFSARIKPSEGRNSTESSRKSSIKKDHEIEK